MCTSRSLHSPNIRPLANMLVIICTGMVGPSLMAADITVATGVSNNGGVVIPVSYRSGGASVAAFQFDLMFDSSVLSVTPGIGPAASSAGKVLQYNLSEA